MKKIKTSIWFTFAVALIFPAACFQDLAQEPPFSYPPNYVPQYSPLKVYLPMDDDEKNASNYRFGMTAIGGNFVDGHIGKTFEATENDFIVAAPPASLVDSLLQLGSFTFSFWINAPRPDGVRGIMSIAKKDHTLGFVNFYFENNNNGDQAYIKGYLRSYPPETPAGKNTWIDVGSVQPEGSSRVEGVWNRWTHLVFRYNGETSKFSIFKDGVAVLNDRLLGSVAAPFGKLAFDPTQFDGKIVFGALAPKAGQTSGTQDAWVVNAKAIEGQYDQIRFYNKALSDTEIAGLYSSRE
ncbi:MAG: LamG domain-containing protein [Tannerella sp.]|jgi:hypothetical protein|nr:LamG domain-containing protein [Tannerella sp.]